MTAHHCFEGKFAKPEVKETARVLVAAHDHVEQDEKPDPSKELGCKQYIYNFKFFVHLINVYWYDEN